METNFEKLYPGDATFEKTSRILKAKKVTAVISDYKKKTSNLTLLDYGCSVGLMTEYFGTKFKNVFGVDVDKLAIGIAKKRNKRKNVFFEISTDELINFKDNFFDVVVFNQIYEHVNNPSKSMKEILRVLKSGGVCYFGARNKYFIVDGHNPIPFLALMPRKLSNFLVRLILKKKYYDISLYSLWGLKKLVKDFKVRDYTLRVFINPSKYSLNKNLKLLTPLAIIFYWLIPNYVWLLEKRRE